jgi:hypothetical protein
MSGTINKATIVGDVSADPEIRKTRAGKTVATFSVARSTRICHFSDENNRKERNMPYRFVDKTRTMIVHEETGQVLEWNPATDKIVSDHGFAGEAYRTPGSPQPLPPVEPARIPDDADRRRRRELAQDARRRGA